MKKLIFILISSFFIAACGSKKSAQQNQKYQVKLMLKEAIYYGDTVSLDPIDTTFIIANTGRVREIDLKNGTPFGVKAYIIPLESNGPKEYVHGLTFHHKEFGKWEHLTSIGSFKSIEMDSLKKVTNSVTDGGNLIFKLKVEYKYSEL